MASDIGISQKYLPTMNFNTQEHINYIENWTQENMMKLNEVKSNYLVFSRSKEPFATRLTMNSVTLERKSVTKILGMWISEDLSWSKNCQEIAKKAYSRLSLITKLKYVGVNRNDLIDIYILFIRSVTEYCAVVFHSSLTQKESEKLERIQKTSLKIILGEEYLDYQNALSLCGLQTLRERREKRCFDFSVKSVSHYRNRRIFPKNPNYDERLRESEPFLVNFAKSESYRKSAVPYCQRILNQYFMKKTVK